MTTTTSTMTRRRSLIRRGAVGLGGAALVLGAGFAAAPAQAADTGVPVLEQIKSCESGGDYTAVNASSGASGAYQFLDSTWQSLSASAGYSTAASAPESVQDAAALELYNAQGTTPWAASESCWAGASTESTTTDTSADTETEATTTEASTEVVSTETDSSSTGSTVAVQDVAVTEPVQNTTAPEAAGAPAAAEQNAQPGAGEQFGQFTPAAQGAAAPAGAVC